MQLHLKVAERSVLERERQLDLPGVVLLGNGIALLAPAELVPQQRVVDITDAASRQSD